MKTTAGQLNHLCDICDPNPAQEADGYPQEAVKPKVMWQDVWAEILSVGGGEKVRGIQIEAGIDSLVTIRWRAGVKPTYYFAERKTNRRLNIVKASDPDGRRVWLNCQCKEVV
jgi:head-tail adaptor